MEITPSDKFFVPICMVGGLSCEYSLRDSQPAPLGTVFFATELLTAIIWPSFLFERAFSIKIPKLPFTCTQLLIVPLVKEVLYTHQLASEAPGWMRVTRMGAAVITGALASLGYMGGKLRDKSRRQKEKIAIVALLWAISRELLLHFLPARVHPWLILRIADSFVFALHEMSGSEIPRFSKIWCYKIVASLYFRSANNYIAQEFGFKTALSQHYLYNFSRAL